MLNSYWVTYYDDLEQRIPRAEIDKFNDICKEIVAEMNED